MKRNELTELRGAEIEVRKEHYQIAAEAAKEIINEARLPIQRNHEAFSAIIKTAIEKAYDAEYMQREKDIQSIRDSFEKAGYPQSRAEHANTQAYKDGTITAAQVSEPLGITGAFNPKGAAGDSERVPEQSSDNMSPAAQASEPLGTTGVKVELAEHFNLVHASEPPSKEQVEKDYRRLIAKENVERAQASDDTKRLVELLRSVHTWFMQQAPDKYNGCGLWIDVDDQLAQHPRSVCILEVDSPTLPPEKAEYYQCGCVNCRRSLAATRKEA